MDEPSPHSIHTTSISPQAKSTNGVKSVDTRMYSKANYKHKMFFKELNILVPKRLTYAEKCAIIISRTTKEPPTEESYEMRIELKYQRGTQSKTITVRANSTREAIEMVYRRITEAGISAVRTRSLILIQDTSTGLYATIGRNEKR